MPNFMWLLFAAMLLVLIAHYVTEGMVRMGFYVAALVVAVVAVIRLVG